MAANETTDRARGARKIMREEAPRAPASRPARRSMGGRDRTDEHVSEASSLPPE
jgi:hypothetical protein